jgi:uncharacterized membrane protein YeiB
VVLAGAGLTLLFSRKGRGAVVARRAAVLGAAGLLLTPAFEGMILHLFAVWFLGAIAFRRASDRALLLTAAALPPLGWLGGEVLGRDAWLRPWRVEDTVTRAADYWQNLAFGHAGYPAVSWFAFVLLGMWLGRRPLRERRWQIGLVLAGGAVVVGAPLLARLAPSGGRFETLASTEAHSAGLPYLAGAAGAAVLAIGACLLVASHAPRLVRPLAAAGSMSLTLYLLHLVPFWLWFEERWARYDGHPEPDAALTPLAVFVVFVAFAVVWRLRFSRGPLEAVLRVASDPEERRARVRFGRARPARDRLHDLPA